MKLLEIQKLNFSYSDQPVLKSIDLEVQEGELISLIGPSGCGKTTLLRLIAGFEKPKVGQILLSGKEVANPNSIIPAEEREVGVVFQNYALFPHLSVRDNILFGCHKMSEKDQATQLKTLSELLNIEAHLDKMPHQLSGGQQQRVAIARTIAHQPRLILFDEPFSNLDAQLKLDLAREIRAIIKRLNLSAILVTHDIQDSLSISDKIAIMQKGDILQYGTPQTLYQEPSHLEVAQFIQPGQLVEVSPSQGELQHEQLGTLQHALGPQALNKLWLKDSDVELKEDGYEVLVQELIFQGEYTVLHCQDSQGQNWKVKHSNDPSSKSAAVSPQIGDKIQIGFKEGLFVF